ncbi:MAG: Immunoglobulin I-set protein, partial [Verrucomicrobiaceae bacterium]|nr:Immunoglobulin I-set protein [Verrucomicrobiaceae bacterium]
WQGKLADGTALTGTNFLGSDGSVRVHHALYSLFGSVQGSVTFAADGSASTSGFGWYKPAQTAASRSYKDGFALHSLDLSGSKFVKPGSGVHVLGLSGTASNAKFTFTDGGLTAELTQLCNFPATNLITFPASNPNLVKITKAVNLATGIFEGSLTVDGRIATFAGIAMQGSSQAHGFFNLPGLLPSATTSPILSGKLVLAAP